MKSVFILMLDGVFDSSLAMTLDMLKSAQAIHRAYIGNSVLVKTQIVGARKGLHATGEGLGVHVTKTFRTSSQPDIVIVPGLGIADADAMASFLTASDTVAAIKFLKKCSKLGVSVTASCSATFLIAEAGLFDNRPATTSWWLSGVFRAFYPEINLQADRLLIADDTLICAGAAMAQADLMMAVIRRLYGEETARLTANYLLIDQRAFQSQYIMSNLLASRHPDVAAAERWARTHLSEQFSISDIANAVGVSARTLARRINEATGVSPVKFIQRLRIEQAIHLLKTTSRSFETIAYNVGYVDASSLRRLLNRETGKGPTQFRARGGQ